MLFSSKGGVSLKIERAFYFGQFYGFSSSMGRVDVAQGTLAEVGKAYALNLKPFSTDVSVFVKFGRCAFKNNAAMAHDQGSVRNFHGNG
jgi:hypothetical protein